MWGSMEYQEFLRAKIKTIKSTGFDIDKEKLNKNAFDWQKDIVKWALKKGKAALFEGCGLGKTIQQLIWADEIDKKTGGKVLILAPLAVSSQTSQEGEKFGITVNVCRSQKEVKDGITITNYEMLSHFEPSEFVGVVLDESSILKSFSGKMRTEIIESFKNTQYRLSCTATPSPNDYEELGNQAEFLGIMTRLEMLSMYFVHDGGETSKWRIKGHAQDKFWEWLSSWAVVIDNPESLGYFDKRYTLPELHTIQKSYEEDMYYVGAQTSLMPEVSLSMTERREARRHTMEERVKIAAEIVNASNEQFVVWCDLNAESELLKKSIYDCVEVKGSDKPEYKTKAAIDFVQGNVKAIVTKPSIFGWGLNWQHCKNMVFVGLSDSFEQYYQAVRRCWRFGQQKEVSVYVVISEREGAVLKNIQRKEQQAEEMMIAMVKHTKNILLDDIKSTIRETNQYKPIGKIQIPVFMR